MRARPTRPRRTKAVTIRLNEADHAALERAAGDEDVSAFCRQIIRNHLKDGERIQRLQLRQQLALREILKRSLLLIPGVDAKKVERIESEVSQSEHLLVQAAISRLQWELEETERQSVRSTLHASHLDDRNRDTSKANEAKCLSIVKALVNLAIDNPGELAGFQLYPDDSRWVTLRAGQYQCEIALPDDPSYKTWCFFVDHVYKAFTRNVRFSWYPREG